MGLWKALGGSDAYLAADEQAFVPTSKNGSEIVKAFPRATFVTVRPTGLTQSDCLRAVMTFSSSLWTQEPGDRAREVLRSSRREETVANVIREHVNRHFLRKRS